VKKYLQELLVYCMLKPKFISVHLQTFNGGTMAKQDLIVRAFKEQVVFVSLGLIEEAFWNSTSKMHEVPLIITQTMEQLPTGSAEYEFCAALLDRVQKKRATADIMTREWFLGTVLRITQWVEFEKIPETVEAHINQTEG
jgi:hypothetical protein